MEDCLIHVCQILNTKKVGLLVSDFFHETTEDCFVKHAHRREGKNMDIEGRGRG